MKMLGKYVYAAAAALSLFSVSPRLATAQEARGKFTLSHEVRWQNAVVPGGEYAFAVESQSPREVLVLRKLSGAPAGFLLISSDVDATTASGPGRLMLVASSGRSYVSAMELPEFGMTLHFAVPGATSEKQLAESRSPSATATSAR